MKKAAAKPKRKTARPVSRARARESQRKIAKERFLRQFAETGNVSEAARAAGVSRDTAYTGWRKSDPEFATLWDEAEKVSSDGIYAEARRRGVEGVEEPVYQGGKKVGTIRRYSDRMLEILLKGHRPEFRERFEAKLDMSVETREVSDDDLVRFLLFIDHEKSRKLSIEEFADTQVYRLALVADSLRSRQGPNGEPGTMKNAGQMGYYEALAAGIDDLATLVHQKLTGQLPALPAPDKADASRARAEVEANPMDNVPKLDAAAEAHEKLMAERAAMFQRPEHLNLGEHFDDGGRFKVVR